MKQKFLIVAAAAALLLVTGCSIQNSAESSNGGSDDPGTTQEAPAGNVWPETVQKNYLDACVATSGGQKAYCQCTLDIAQETYPVEEFAALEAKLSSDPSIAEDFTALLAPCAAELE